MNIKLKTSYDYIISQKILSQEGEFVVDDIINSLSEELKNIPIEIDEIRTFVTEKLSVLCDVGLVSCTTKYYYIN